LSGWLLNRRESSFYSENREADLERSRNWGRRLPVNTVDKPRICD
jgi:hypothetical protein